MASTTSQKVHLIFLYHPQVDITTSPIPNAILKRLSTLYGHPKNLLIGQIRYGQLHPSSTSTPANVDLDTLLSPNSKLSATSFVSTDEFIRINTAQQINSNDSFLIDTWSDVRAIRRRPWQDELDELTLGSESKQDAVLCIADGLVAAGEMFARFSITTNPLARYLVHLIPDSSSKLDLRNDIHPHSNLDSTHDQWNWDRAATELGKIGAWPSTVVLPDSGASIAMLSVEAERLHRTISDNLPPTLPSISDAPSILGASFRPVTFAKGMLLSGYSDAAGTAARAAANANIPITSRKRQRRQSVKGGQLGGQTNKNDEGAGGSILNVNGASANTISQPLPDTTPRKSVSEAQAIQKVLFLQQQQQMMMRNVKILQQQEEDKGSNKGSPTRNRLLNQFREQLDSQQDALRSYQIKLSSGGLIPDLNNSLNALMAIDREATNQGIHLGGPSNMQALVARHRQQLLAQQQKAQEQLAGTAPSTAQPSVPPSTTTIGEVSTQPTDVSDGQQVRKPGGQVFWVGAITWNMALPNKQRNHAATFVMAQCAPNTDQSTLLLPWPQKFTISEVKTVSLSTMQQYATSHGTPCIIFNPKPLPNSVQGGPSPDAPSANKTNETMYMMLARMIDSKKGCAYMKLQDAPNAPAEAGIVIVPTAPAPGSTARRLLGLVFKEPVPWHMFLPQTVPGAAVAVQPGTVAANVQSTQAGNVFARPPSTPQAPPALFQQQQASARPVMPQTPQQSQQIGVSTGGTPSQATPIPPAMGTLSALSAAQMTQQIPAWAASALANQQQQPKQNAIPASLAALQQAMQMNAGGMLNTGNANFGGNNENKNVNLANIFGGGDGNRMNIDFNALASQLNIPVNRTGMPNQQQTSQQQGNPAIFNQSIWSDNNNANNTNPMMNNTTINPNAFANINNAGIQPPAGGQGMSSADLEALQRILGLTNN